jgi:hypothetical protein
MYWAASNRQKQRTSASAGAQVVHGASGLLHHAKPRAEVADRLRHAEQRLGIAAEIKPKTKLSTLATLYASVASGEVEIGFNQVSEIWLNANRRTRCTAATSYSELHPVRPGRRYRQRSD